MHASDCTANEYFFAEVQTVGWQAFGSIMSKLWRLIIEVFDMRGFM
jgi:hypothetical protein